MEHYLYLTIDILIILFPLLFSFQSKANLLGKWKFIWLAILLPAVFFIVWDEWFTAIGVWSFNTKYLTGIYFFSLPIEEILFFVCVPYACLFIYIVINHFIRKDFLQPYHRTISLVLICFLFTSGILNLNKWYTSSTFILTSGFLFTHIVILKTEYMGRFYFAFIFILIPFFIMNGILTGTGIEEPVVKYNDSQNLGLRIGTIPFEDVFYGMALILMNISVFEGLQKRKAR
jgi:lycopene cyclase domain-containing protein